MLGIKYELNMYSYLPVLLVQKWEESYIFFE